jgi:hypothetical protein
MWFLPYESVILESPLSRQEVLDKLDSVVESRSKFRYLFSRNHKPYRGKVSGDRFEVSRIIYYRNSFLPIITGEIISGYPGSSVKLVMHPRPLVIVFGVIVLGVLGPSAIFILSESIEALVRFGSLDSMEISRIAPLGVLVVVYLLYMIGFKPEAAKSLKFFRELFDAT